MKVQYYLIINQNVNKYYCIRRSVKSQKRIKIYYNMMIWIAVAALEQVPNRAPSEVAAASFLPTARFFTTPLLWKVLGARRALRLPTADANRSVVQSDLNVRRSMCTCNCVLYKINFIRNSQYQRHRFIPTMRCYAMWTHQQCNPNIIALVVFSIVWEIYFQMCSVWFLKFVVVRIIMNVCRCFSSKD